MMRKKINLNNILFLDIETVPEVEDYNELDSEMKDLWDIKPNTNEKNTLPKTFTVEQEYGLNLETSVYFVIKGDVRNFRVTSFFGEEEDFEGFQ
jgi:hypothetical protein